ncbi:hypothetical protein CLU79DRAFT_755995 [Phycomyces nitens]|nr:hypothetical protein CLU79DRAFT_755995 [Phycomyces nitens]
MDPNERIDKLKILSGFLSETLKRGEEKVALAKSTFDTVRNSRWRQDPDCLLGVCVIIGREELQSIRRGPCKV